MLLTKSKTGECNKRHSNAAFTRNLRFNETTKESNVESILLFSKILIFEIFILMEHIGSNAP